MLGFTLIFSRKMKPEMMTMMMTAGMRSKSSSSVTSSDNNLTYL
jgi:hypothetical protein